jgi:hypothetical protein
MAEDRNPYEPDTAEAYLWGVANQARKLAAQHLRGVEDNRRWAEAALERAEKYEAALAKLVRGDA